MENVNNMFNSIKMTSPVKVFDFNIESNPMGSIIGLYLTTMINDTNKLSNVLRSKVVMDDITDESLLFFDKRHVYEVCTIINGMLEYFEKLNAISERNDIIRQLFNITSSCMSYKDFKSNISILISAYTMPTYQYLSGNLINIVLNYIWFIPYNGLNELYNEAVEFYNNEKGNNSNDG